MTDTIYWIWFQTVFGPGTRRSGLMLSYFGGPMEIFEGIKHPGKIRDMLTAEEKKRAETALTMAENIIGRTLKKGCAIITPDMDVYPAMLHEIYARPAALYVKGDLGCLRDAPAIAVIGSRESTVYGKRVTQKISGELASAGAVVISGLARGIDSAAHQAALDAGGKTIGILGCGIDIDYPSRSGPLKRAVSENGAVVTEFPLGTEPYPANFPIRNRIVSGISHGVLVTEASYSSGALITANLALEQGRDVFVVPGDIFDPLSLGKHKLLQEGAKAVGSADDILTEYPMFLRHEKKMHKQAGYAINLKEEPELAPVEEQEKIILSPRQKPLPEYASPEAAEVYAFIGSEPVEAGSLEVQSGLGTSQVLSALTELEIFGMVRMYPGRKFGLIENGK